MKSHFVFLWIAGAILWPATGFGQSPSSSTDVMVLPPSSVEHSSDVGVRAHTNHLILVRPQKPSSAHSSSVPRIVPAPTFATSLPAGQATSENKPAGILPPALAAIWVLPASNVAAGGGLNSLETRKT